MPDKIESPCVLGNLNRSDITKLKDDFKGMSTDIKEIKDKLLNRPPWMVVFFLTGCVTMIGVLLTIILK